MKAMKIFQFVFMLNLALLTVPAFQSLLGFPSTITTTLQGDTNLYNTVSGSTTAPDPSESSLFGDWAWAASVINMLFNFATGNYGIWANFGVPSPFLELLSGLCLISNMAVILSIVSKFDVR